MRNIYYFCPDHNAPSGGVLMIYEHVRILTNAGYTVFVLHQKFGFKCKWFNHTVNFAYPVTNFLEKLKAIYIEIKEKILKKSLHHVVWYKGLQLQNQNGEPLPPISDQDVLVIPEYAAHTYHFHHHELPFVIFNQNSYFTFNFLPLPSKQFNLQATSTIYHSKNLLGLMTVSVDNCLYLKMIFPHLPLFHTRNAIHKSIFSFSDQKNLCISFMPRKCEQDVRQVILILQERNQLKNWKFYSINHNPLMEVAQILKQSAIFLSFGYQEGFFLPPAEALACGCTLIGYHGQAGKEYFPSDSMIESGNIISFVQKIETIALDYERHPEKYLNEAKVESEKILSAYSEENQKIDVLHAWAEFQKIIKQKSFHDIDKSYF